MTQPTTIAPYLCCDGAANAITFYERAFGAVEQYRIPNADGTLGHAELSIGTAVLMLSDPAPGLGVVSPLTQEGSSLALSLSVPNPDEIFERAIEAGATVERPMVDEPYGRSGWLFDPSGHRWHIMRPVENFDPASMNPE